MTKKKPPKKRISKVKRKKLGAKPYVGGRKGLKNRAGFKTLQYKKWWYAVVARDKHTCQWPECKTKKIQVHHIKRWADCPGLRYEVKNAICLCRKHHRLVTGKEQQYERMLFTIVYKKHRHE